MLFNKQQKKDIYWRYMTVDFNSENIHRENSNLNPSDLTIYRKQLEEQMKKFINNLELFSMGLLHQKEFIEAAKNIFINSKRRAYHE